jgi:dinuclear metal center YbgI/SA1388 family protein
MPVPLRDIVSFLDRTLEIDRFRDYAPNGLQVEGSAEVDTVVTGVSASAALLERAVEHGADLVVVHHGLLWGSTPPALTGPLARRLRLLFAHDVSLCGYHLPLDKHPRLGNNAGIADALGLGADRDAFGEVRGCALGLAASWPEALPRDEALARIGAAIGGQPPRFVFADGPDHVRRVGICSGAASDLLEAAAEAGCDLFLTGELAERAGDLARELQVTLVAAGHYATEVFGPMRLAAAIAAEFPALAVEFVPSPSPL